MKKILHSLNKRTVIIFTALALIGSVSVQAQIGLPNDDPNVIDVPETPIDGFIITGLIAGAALGLRNKIRGLKK